MAGPQLAPLRLLGERLVASGRRALPRGDAGPPGAQPPPQVLERAASTVADVAAFSLSTQADGKKGRKRVSGPRKRGTTVTFGSAKWELVVQMMLGIRRAAEPEPEP